MPNRRTLFALVAAGLTLTAAAMAQSAGMPITYERLLDAANEPGNWLMYSGDYRSHHYSSLSQITAANVHRLRARWIYQMHKQKVARPEWPPFHRG